jgi:6-pyruvoyltetrahydropterin/6-carboxytetrahydropterin synthase
MPGHKTVLLESVPTAENLAQTAFDILNTVFEGHFGADLHLKSVKLYETPNCWAEISRP